MRIHSSPHGQTDMKITLWGFHRGSVFHMPYIPCHIHLTVFSLSLSLSPVLPIFKISIGLSFDSLDVKIFQFLSYEKMTLNKQTEIRMLKLRSMENLKICKTAFGIPEQYSLTHNTNPQFPPVLQIVFICPFPSPAALTVGFIGCRMSAMGQEKTAPWGRRAGRDATRMRKDMGMGSVVPV
jgi:hypothetical protein